VDKAERMAKLMEGLLPVRGPGVITAEEPPKEEEEEEEGGANEVHATASNVAWAVDRQAYFHQLIMLVQAQQERDQAVLDATASADKDNSGADEEDATGGLDDPSFDLVAWDNGSSNDDEDLYDSFGLEEEKEKGDTSRSHAAVVAAAAAAVAAEPAPTSEAESADAAATVSLLSLVSGAPGGDWHLLCRHNIAACVKKKWLVCLRPPPSPYLTAFSPYFPPSLPKRVLFFFHVFNFPTCIHTMPCCAAPRRTSPRHTLPRHAAPRHAAPRRTMRSVPRGA
jgi:hypothetical protein